MATEVHSVNLDVCMEPGKGQILLGEGREGSKVTFVGACKTVFFHL